MKRATERLLAAIRENERGSYQEWRAAAGIASVSSIRYHLLKLEEAGLVRLNPGKARSVELLSKESSDG